MALTTFGKYDILSELGRGAMGIVYEARSADREESVALKVMSVPANPSVDSVRRQVERFYREARALQRLEHPRIVRLYEQGEVGGRPFFSMERVSGTNLRDKLQFQGALSLPELVRLTTEVSEALDHAHARGVIHRDIKPENIMFLPDGGSRLMDFGIARILPEDDPSVSAGFQGSPAYMSPEQAHCRPVDGRSDTYSLAITLYEAATGRRAFEGDSVAVITQKVLHEYPLPPAGLPHFFQGALMRAMSKEPAHRYARAGEMAEDIRLGRMPNFNFSPVAAPAAPTYTPPPPVYLGDAHSGSAAPPSYQPAYDGQTLVTPPQAASQVTVCRMHSARGVDLCASCVTPVCHGCLVEIPGRGIVCRLCAFGR